MWGWCVQPHIRRNIMSEQSVILFLGASVTSGFGLSKQDAYPAIIQSFVSEAGMNYHIANAGWAGAATKDGIAQLQPFLSKPGLEHLVIALGLADAVYHISPVQIKDNIRDLVHLAREHHPDVKIYLLQSKVFQPFVLQRIDGDYVQNFEQTFVDVANEWDLNLLPFMLEGIAGHYELNQPDGIHPNSIGMQRVAQNIWKHLRKHL